MYSLEVPAFEGRVHAGKFAVFDAFAVHLEARIDCGDGRHDYLF